MQSYQLFGIAAGILQICGYLAYALEVRKSRIKPNAGSWIIWGYGNIIVCLTYLFAGSVSSADILPIVCSVCSLVMTIWFVKIGTFNKITGLEKKMIALDILLTLGWIAFSVIPTSIDNPAIPVHVILQISAIVSFVPIIREVYYNRDTERHTPWIIWTSAYILFFIAEILAGAPWYKLIYPLNYVILHGLIGLFSYSKKVKML